MQREICRLPVFIILLKRQNHWHFSNLTNLVLFCLFVLVFLSFLTFLFKRSAILRVKQISGADVNKPSGFDFCILFLKPLSGDHLSLLQPEQITKTMLMVSQHSQQHIKLQSLPYIWWETNQAQLSFNTFSSFKPQKSQWWLNYLQEGFSFTFDMRDMEHPACTSC